MNNNCFARNRQNSCRALYVYKCSGNDCPFYKNFKKFDEDREQAIKRLANLSLEKQQHISNKYYDGKMPWLQGGGSYEC